MKITIEPTKTMTLVDGCAVRVWKGLTDCGAPCVVFVAMVSANEGHEAAFHAALKQLPPPAEIQDVLDVLDSFLPLERGSA